MAQTRSWIAVGWVVAGLALPAGAQTWTKPVNLGPTTGPGFSLAMNASGAAEIAFPYALGQNPGAIALSQIAAGQPWHAAGDGFAQYDASNPGIGLDDGGASLLLFNGGQIDNFNSVFDACQEASFSAGFTTCNYIATTATSAPPQIIMTHPGNFYLPVFLIGFGCALVADDGNGNAATLTGPQDCFSSSRFALAPSGAGAAIFRTRAGLVRAAVHSGGHWGQTVTLATAGALPPAGLAASAGADGTTLLAWSLGQPGRVPTQVWAVEVSAAGVLEAPVEVSAAACGTGIAAATLPNGVAVLGYPGRGAKPGCDALLAAKPAGGAFAPAMAATSGAHLAGMAEVATAGGHLVLAWQNGNLGADFAAYGSLAGFGAPARLGGLAPPALAAGGGLVNAAWCTQSCYAATIVLP